MIRFEVVRRYAGRSVGGSGRICAALAVLVATTQLAPATLTAQEGDSRRPVLGDHRFVPNTLTDGPFARTQIRQNLGVGQLLDLDLVPEFVIGDDTISGIQGDLLFAQLELEYQHAIKEWLGFWAQVGLSGRLGTDVGAILTEGATLVTGFELGWLVRLMENERMALSATANVSNSRFTGINFFEWAEGIVDDEPVPLVRKTPSIRAGVGLRFAWAANEWLGLNATGETGYGEPLVRTESDRGYLSLAGGASVDLDPITPVPIGFSLAFKSTNFPENGSDIADKVTQGSFQIAYTAKDDFVLALENTFAVVSRLDADDVNSGSITLGMRYYF